MSHLIEYNDVTLLRKEHVVLKHVCFKVDKGEFVYLIGKVGSGKSTLLKSIYADVPVEEGDAQVLDYSLNKIKRKQIPFLRRKIGFVFQDFQLLMDRNVFSNLEFVLRATGWKDKTGIEERIDEVLASVGMTDKSYKMPHELSGGEQQRIVISRALLNKPDLILADEPTGNLDPETGDLVIRRLHDIAKTGTAVIVATHNHTLLSQYPGRVLNIKDGKCLIP